jgi:hypothetical protein
MPWANSRPLDAIDIRRPLMDHPTTFAVRAPHILFVDTRNADNRPHVPLIPDNEQQRRSKCQRSLRNVKCPRQRM